MTLYRHSKGNVYRVLKRRAAYAPLYEGEYVLIDLGEEDVVAQVTDDITGIAEEFVVYQDVSAPGKVWARPARMFDQPERFTPLEGGEA